MAQANALTEKTIFLHSKILLTFYIIILQVDFIGIAVKYCPRPTGAEKGSENSDIEEDGFVFALQINIEAIDDLRPAHLALGDEGLAAHFPLNQIQHRVGLVGILFVGEVHPRVEANINPAGDHP